MNTSNTIFPNIGNRNTTSHDLGNDNASRMSSRVSKVTLETAQQKGISFIPQDSRLGDEYNGMHSNQHKRTVDLKGAETYLTPSDRDGVVCHESIDSNNDTENLLGSSEWPSFTETVKSFFTSLVPQMKEGCKAFAWNPKPKVIAASLLSYYSPVFSLGRTAISLFLLVSSTAVTDAESEVKNTALPNKVKRSNNTIGINDSKILEKIGTDNEFPSDGNYELTANIDAINFTKSIEYFQGDFNGRNNTISNLQISLVQKLNNGTIRNLTISNANITDGYLCLATLACFVDGDSKISHSQCEDSKIQVNSGHSYTGVGMISAYLSGSSQIENVSVKNCTIEIDKLSVSSGGLIGAMGKSSKSSHNTVDGCSIIINEDHSDVGALFGSMAQKALSSNDTVVNCRIEINGSDAGAGGAVGYFEHDAKIIKVRVSDSIIDSGGKNSSAGIVAGRSVNVFDRTKTSISDSTAINSRATVIHESSKAGIWVGKASGYIHLHNNTDRNCTIEFPGSRERTTTAANLTTATNLTTTKPAMIADDVSSLSSEVFFARVAIGSVVTLASIGLTGCFSYFLYNGYQEGKRGLSLAAHPFASFGKLLDGCYKSCTGFQPVATNNRADDTIEMIEIVSR